MELDDDESETNALKLKLPRTTAMKIQREQPRAIKQTAPCGLIKRQSPALLFMRLPQNGIGYNERGYLSMTEQCVLIYNTYIYCMCMFIYSDSLCKLYNKVPLFANYLNKRQR